LSTPKSIPVLRVGPANLQLPIWDGLLKEQTLRTRGKAWEGKNESRGGHSKGGTFSWGERDTMLNGREPTPKRNRGGGGGGLGPFVRKDCQENTWGTGGTLMVLKRVADSDLQRKIHEGGGGGGARTGGGGQFGCRTRETRFKKKEQGGSS